MRLFGRVNGIIDLEDRGSFWLSPFTIQWNSPVIPYIVTHSRRVLALSTVLSTMNDELSRSTSLEGKWEKVGGWRNRQMQIASAHVIDNVIPDPFST
jgi:hypothetical protein